MLCGCGCRVGLCVGLLDTQAEASAHARMVQHGQAGGEAAARPCPGAMQQLRLALSVQTVLLGPDTPRPRAQVHLQILSTFP